MMIHEFVIDSTGMFELFSLPVLYMIRKDYQEFNNLHAGQQVFVDVVVQ